MHVLTHAATHIYNTDALQFMQGLRPADPCMSDVTQVGNGSAAAHMQIYYLYSVVVVGDHVGALTQRPRGNSDMETSWELQHEDHEGALKWMTWKLLGSSD